MGKSAGDPLAGSHCLSEDLREAVTFELAQPMRSRTGPDPGLLTRAWQPSHAFPVCMLVMS